ncbi:MAG: transposase [Legionellaceae bacterium]|nr:transposase [Legionellaceae bacterium]
MAEISEKYDSFFIDDRLNIFLINIKKHLRFLHNRAVPFTDNDAERDLRMMKCKQKISGGFRSTQGVEQFARIHGFISTLRKQGFNVLNSIQSVFSGNMLIPAGY